MRAHKNDESFLVKFDYFKEVWHRILFLLIIRIRIIRTFYFTMLCKYAFECKKKSYYLMSWGGGGGV